jgi:7-carboxy-7-deazaguanine synthase
MTSRDWLLVSETFFTLQGEGPSTGKPAFFIRLGACNMHCSWCDTAYTWAFSEAKAAQHESHHVYDANAELTRVPLIRLSDQIIDSGAQLIVITGGEPLLQAETVARLISQINEYPGKRRFEIETAGTLSPKDLSMFENVSFNVSPKLASSGNAVEERYKPDELREFMELDSRFKFVIGDIPDVMEVEEIVDKLCIPPSRVWIMPLGTTPDAIVMGLKHLSGIAIGNHWNLSSRQHVLIWGDKRGH